MSTPDEFRELLFADVALMRGHAEARGVAAALLRYWDRRAHPDVTLRGELARVANVDAAALDEIEAEVERLVTGASGDSRLAVTQRGGLAHELHTAVSRKSRDVSRHLTELGAGIRIALRPLAADRYLDFMPVGEGGMGVVYWAMDTELNRQVAFKVIRPPSSSPHGDVTPPAPLRMAAPADDAAAMTAFDELKARFLQEAWVTGGMEHPGIVPVYELGCTEGGVPYYTMRFVRGRRTLRTAVEELASRSIDERLTLLEPFLKICDAVRYAHSRGVIHRDLKPENVALGEYGEAIVLDWGLAKLKGHPDVHASRWQGQVQTFREATNLRTVESAVGTPGFMSPEAAAGDVEAVDELSDVYSLGAILFQIVTGRLPVTFQDFEEYTERVQAEDALDAREIDPAIPAALAELCASALSRSKRQRPASVDDLAQGVRSWRARAAVEREIETLLDEVERVLGDTSGMTDESVLRQSERATTACQRILEHRPDHAAAKRHLEQARAMRDIGIRAQGAATRRLFVKRVAIGGLFALAVIGAIVAWVIEGRRQEAESARAVARLAQADAETQRVQAEGAMDFIINDMRESLEPIGRLDLLAKIGERAREHYRQIPVEEDKPESLKVRTGALRGLGDVYYRQGVLPDAKMVYAEAVEAAARYEAIFPGDLRGQFERARSEAKVARVVHDQGYPKPARETLLRVVSELDAMSGTDVDPVELMAARAEAHVALAGTFRAATDYQTAMKHYRRALDIAEDLADRPDTGYVWKRGAIRYALYAATGLRYAGHPDESSTLIENTLRRARTLVAQHPKDMLAADLLCKALTARGVQTADPAEALKLYDEALPIYRRLVDLDEQNFAWRSSLARLQRVRGDAFNPAGGSGPGPKSADAFREAYGLCQSLILRDPTNAGWHNEMITACDRMARVANVSKDRLGARTLRDEAVRHARRLMDLQGSNVRWRFILVYTLWALAVEIDQEDRARLPILDEARTMMVDILIEVPHAEDVANVYASVHAEILYSRIALGEIDRAIAASRSAFELLFSALEVPDATQAFLVVAINNLSIHNGRLIDQGDAARAHLEWVYAACVERFDAYLARTELSEPERQKVQGWQRDAKRALADLGG